MPPKKKVQSKTEEHTAKVEHGEKHASRSRYSEGVGRRKTAIARVRLSAGKGGFVVNNKDLKSYFALPRLEARAKEALDKLNVADKFDVSVKIVGGGIHAQADAMRLGISRALILKDKAFRPQLQAFGFLTRDSRMVERKKFGLRKARRAPQWAKR